MISPSDILKNLNDAQKQAVTYNDGHLLIMAGAGSGKTRVLTHRIAYICNQNWANLEDILAITFTNKAANEMRYRLQNLLQIDNIFKLWVSTFHSSCVRILRSCAEKLGYTNNFTIYDTLDSKNLVKMVMRELQISTDEIKPETVQSTISALKNREYALEDITDKTIATIYEEYQTRMKRANAMDFDDLLLNVVQLLKKYPEIRSAYQNKFKYIFVDEYQDTNMVQYKLLRLLTGPNTKVTVVGDSDQSIYAFRGADIRNILEFEKDFKNAKTIKLEQNYRSTNNILKAANSLISNKQLFSDLGDGEKITVYNSATDKDEANYICREIGKQIANNALYSQMAIFYRTNAQSRILEEYLLKYSIPYKIVGGTMFYDRKEVKDLLAYLKIIVNPFDDVSVVRVINVPKRGIGQTTVQKLQQIAAAEQKPLYIVLKNIDKLPEFPESVKTKVKAFLAVFDGLNYQAADATAIFVEILNRTGYLEILQNSMDPQDQSRAENVNQLWEAIKEFDSSQRLDEFLEQTALIADTDALPDQDKGVVSLMTLHSAKGLEYNIVFLAGLEEGLLPHSMSIDSKQELEEEKRLAYVGITRAKQKLYLTHSNERFNFGSISKAFPSRFLKEIDTSVIESLENDRSYISSAYRPKSNKLKYFDLDEFADYFEDTEFSE